MKHTRKPPVAGHYRALFEIGSFSGLSDAELLACFINREAELSELAFAAIVERHATAVLRICRAITRNEHDAEDAFQATFLILATKAAGLRVRESLGPWLCAVAERVSRGARAVTLARAARELRAAELAVVRAFASESRSELSSIVHEEIDRLPERYRLPLFLCDMEGYTHQEAARRLGWPLGTVKSRQARARARLRARLIRRGLSETLPMTGPFGLAHSAISASLIRSTARAAVDLLSRETTACAVSASVATLVKSSLRATIVSRLTGLIGVVLLISVGVAASVLAQGQPTQKTATQNSVSANAVQSDPSPVFEYEIRIWKDGAPVTPTMKLRANPDDVSEVKIPEGTFELRFRPRGDSGKRGGDPDNADTSARTNADATRTSLANVREELAKQMIKNKLNIIAVESDLKTLENAKKMSEEDAKQRLVIADKERDDKITEEFQKDPGVIHLRQEIEEADEQRAQAKRRARAANDPARQVAEQKYKKLRIDYGKLWKVKSEEIGTRLKASREAAIVVLERKLETLKAQAREQLKLYEQLIAEKPDSKAKK